MNRKWVAARKKAGLPADLVLPPRHSKALTMKQMDTVFSYGTRIGTRMKNGIHTPIATVLHRPSSVHCAPYRL